MSKEDIISDVEIERVHGSANFGSMSKRHVVDEGVLKSAFGYEHGYTAAMILIAHGLIKKDRLSLTKKGFRYLRELNAYRPALAHILGKSK